MKEIILIIAYKNFNRLKELIEFLTLILSYIFL
jgi:hypothetical protein